MQPNRVPLARIQVGQLVRIGIRVVDPMTERVRPVQVLTIACGFDPLQLEKVKKDPGDRIELPIFGSPGHESGVGDNDPRRRRRIWLRRGRRRGSRCRSWRRVWPDGRRVPPFAPAVIVPGAHADDDVLRVVGIERDAGGLNVSVVVDGPVPAPPVVVAVHGVVLGRPWHSVPGRGYCAVRARHRDAAGRTRRPLLRRRVWSREDHCECCDHPS